MPRHLMKPDPDAEPITLKKVLWTFVLVIGIVVAISLLSPH